MTNGHDIRFSEVEQIGDKFLMTVQLASGKFEEYNGDSMEDLKRQNLRAFNKWDRRTGGIYVVHKGKPKTMIAEIERPIADIITNRAEVC